MTEPVSNGDGGDPSEKLGQPVGLVVAFVFAVLILTFVLKGVL